MERKRPNKLMKIITNYTFPQTYQAAVLDAAGTALKIATKQISELKKGEVWVQIKAAPINPSDLAMLAGTYPHQKNYPFVPGLEASGKVVASGGGFMANFILGKRVACSAPENRDGTWAEFMKVEANKCVPLSANLSFLEGASALVNPLTALTLIKKVKESSKCFVNTAAAGALGKMLIKLAEKENLTAINCVRNASQVAVLQQMGAKNILDTSATNFESDYKKTCAAHPSITILDAVGGSFSNILLQHAPEKTRLIAYASLSKENIEIAPQTIIRGGKNIEGFHLGTWLKTQPLLTKMRLIRESQKLIKAGTLSTEINQTFTLSQLNEAVFGYQQNMSAGKWLLRFED